MRSETELAQVYSIRFFIRHPLLSCELTLNWATVTVTDGAGKRYSLDVEAESTYDAAHLFLTKAKEHVIREPLPIPSLETVFEVTVNGKVHRVPGAKLQRWIMK